MAVVGLGAVGLEGVGPGAVCTGGVGTGVRDVTTGRVVRWGLVVGAGALWWWAVTRLLLVPGAGALEGAIAAGGWGLSVLPVHCVPRARAAGVPAAGRWRRAWRAGDGAVAEGIAGPPGWEDGGAGWREEGPGGTRE
ncbi:hypothetical protein [Streptomyces virens]|uniref:hypothetical protein n=1 Tax=Streptomyces virens TaxID=285572 RepID=UPI0017C3355B|nr:hypothetical protein [Streptomyces calvus]